MQKSRRDLGSALALGVVFSLSLAAPGCNKKERAVAPGPPGLPAFSQTGQSGQGGGSVHPPEGMPSDHPPVLRGMTSPTEGGGHGEGAAPAQAAGTSFLRGTLKLGDKVRDKVQAGATLFLAARAFSSGGAPGQVLAVKRLTAGSWPMTFELTGSDVMIAGTSLQGKVVLTARIDQDGEAMTKQPGDIEGQLGPIDVPNSAVELTLDTVRTQAAGAPGGMGGGGMGGGGMPPGHPPTGMPAGHP
jgi:hypothetical protein